MKQSYHFLMILFISCFTTKLYSQAVPSYVPTNGLVGWWGFNGNAQDGSGNGNHGTVNGATLTTDRFGNQNGAYSFDGNLNHIQIQPSLTLNNFNNAITISTWIYSVGPSGNPSYGGQDLQGIFGPATHLGGDGGFFLRLFDSNWDSVNNRVVDFACALPYNGILNNNSSSLVLNTNTWVNVICTFNSPIVKIYRNGMLVDSLQVNFGLSGSLNTSGRYYTIGQCIDWWGSGVPIAIQSFNGKIDDIGIWNRALTPQEITNLYNSQLSTQTSLCLPSITTNTPTSIGIDSVIVGGNILNDGGSSIVLRGVCYSTTPNPNMGNMRTEDGSGVGSFTSILRNLSPTMTYYARSYAKNSNGVVVYGNEVTFTTLPLLGQPCPGTPTVTDIDGNVYNTVKIGNQCWMQSNLKVSRYRNGDSIVGRLNNWGLNNLGAFAIYDNNLTYDSLFGKLYNHYAVSDVRGICPIGWKVPSNSEIDSLINHSNGLGSHLKSRNTFPSPNGWAQPNLDATDSLFFMALPGGLVGDVFGNNTFSSFYAGFSGHWWTSTISNADAYGFTLYSNIPWIYPGLSNRKAGFSVRCLRDSSVGGGGSASVPSVTTVAISGVTSTGASTGGNVTSDGGTAVTSRGVAYGLSTNPTTSGTITIDGSGMGSFVSTLTGLTSNAQYHVRAYANNSVGTAYGNEVTFTTLPLLGQPCPGTPTVSDIDGNIYNTVKIGNQCWMQSNLRTSKYRNGDSINSGLNNNDWNAATTGAYGQQNLPGSLEYYGNLYNHYAVSDNRGLCPTGWRVPTIQEWFVLADFLGGQQIAGGKLKQALTQPQAFGWDAPNVGATNESGYSAYGAGFRDIIGHYSLANVGTFFWSSSIFQGRINASYAMSLFYSDAIFSLYDYTTYSENRNGFSVRCLRDSSVGGGGSASVPSVTTVAISGVSSTGASTGGDVTSDGGSAVTSRGVAYGLSTNPTTSGTITIEGSGMGSFVSTLTGLTSNAQYHVRAYANNSVGTAYGNEVTFTTLQPIGQPCPGTPTVTDIDGNIYNTVKIGNQCWTQSNLKVSRFRNGDSILTGFSNNDWYNLFYTPAYSIYNNDPQNNLIFGKLYNHESVRDSREICPTGWHVPTDTEWNVLVKFLDSDADTSCNNCVQSPIAGGALKSTSIFPIQSGWMSPNTGATNSSGFFGTPGGMRDGHTGTFNDLGNVAFWWTSSTSHAGYPARVVLHNGANVNKGGNFHGLYGFSVRCLKD